MTFLAVVIFPHATTASAAAEHVRRVDERLALDDASLAVVSCDENGDFAMTTLHPGDAGVDTAGAWFLIVDALVLLPMSGALSAIRVHVLGVALVRAGLDRDFQRAVHDGLVPGSSALFLLLEEEPTEEALASLRHLAGVVHVAHLAPDAEQHVARALVVARGGTEPAVAAAVPGGPGPRRPAGP